MQRFEKEPITFEARTTFLVLPTKFVGTFAAGETTPSVLNVEKFKSANVAPVSITNFLFGQNGQELMILGDGFITIVDGANIKTNTGANKLLLADTTYKFTLYDNVWYEQVGGSGGSGGLADGNYGDVTVSGVGTVITINTGVVSYAKIQDVSSGDRLLGRITGAGDVEEITCTTAGRALLDDADASAQRTTLGLGTAALNNTGDFDAAGTAAAAVANRVVGPGSSTDNALVRFDGLTGLLVQDSVALLSDTGALSGLISLNIAGGAATEPFIVTTTGTVQASFRYDATHKLDIEVNSIGYVDIRASNRVRFPSLTQFTGTVSFLSSGVVSIERTGSQLQIKYDSTVGNDVQFSVDSSGNLSMAPTGANDKNLGLRYRVSIADESGSVSYTDSVFLNLPAGTTTASQVRFAHGVAPTAPVNGDFWSTTSGFFGRVNSVTIGPFLDQNGNARVAINKNSGATVGTRRRINFIEGSNVTLTIADDAGNEEVDVTIAASGGGGGGGTTGTTEVDFGSGGSTNTTVAITGQASIIVGSRVEAWIECTATAGHSIDEHAAADIDIRAGNISAGVGFTIYAVSRSGLQYDTYTVGWRWT